MGNALAPRIAGCRSVCLIGLIGFDAPVVGTIIALRNRDTAFGQILTAFHCAGITVGKGLVTGFCAAAGVENPDGDIAVTLNDVHIFDRLGIQPDKIKIGPGIVDRTAIA